MLGTKGVNRVPKSKVDMYRFTFLRRPTPNSYLWDGTVIAHFKSMLTFVVVLPLTFDESHLFVAKVRDKIDVRAKPLIVSTHRFNHFGSPSTHSVCPKPKEEPITRGGKQVTVTPDIVGRVRDTKRGSISSSGILQFAEPREASIAHPSIKHQRFPARYPSVEVLCFRQAPVIERILQLFKRRLRPARSPDEAKNVRQDGVTN